MALLQFAFSVHNFISSIGADAGFAAIIGLAVLILLYFAHARETANLREEAALLTQRLQQAEARVLQLTRAQPAASQAAPVNEQAPAHAPLAPFAPAGMAAPPLAAATRLVRLAEPPAESEAAEDTPEPMAASVAAMAMAGVAAPSAASSPPLAVSPPPAPPPAAPEVPPEAAPPASPLPAPAPTSTPKAPPSRPAVPVAGAPARPAVPAPATSAGANGAGHQPVAAPARATEPSWSGKISASRGSPSSARQLPPPGTLPPLRPQTRRSGLGRGVAVALVALAAVAVAVVVFALTSIGSNKKSPTVSTTNAPVPGHASAGAAFKPSSVTVAVLNGTSTNQLAHRIGQKLAGFGYREGTVATAVNQTETATVVAYVGGTSDRTRAAARTAALHVAQALGLRPSAVRPVDQSTLQVACPTSTACTANVVVTVGADLANQ